MRTLKTFVIAASMFLFAVPVTAANYPPEMPDIKNAPIQFVCRTQSSWFIKLYLAKTWQTFIAGRDKEEMVIKIVNQDKYYVFVFVPTIGDWKNVSNLRGEKIDELLEKIFGPGPTEEDSNALQSCVDFNLRSLGLPQ